MHKGRWTGRSAIVACALLCAAMNSAGATKKVGDIADQFVVPNHLEPTKPLDLYTYAGSILVIDFWAYWCGYCKVAAPSFEADVRLHYLNQGGNAAGIPVEVITISIDNGDLNAVQNFINTYHPHVVGLANGQAWSQFSLNTIPHFTVINCSAQSESHQQWEIVYSQPVFNLAAIRGAIDSITRVTDPYEKWKREHFTEAERTDPLICAEDADPDRDGLNNLQEYTFELLPKQPNTEGMPTLGVESNYLAVSYRHSKRATDVVCAPEVCSSLEDGDWSTNGVVETTRIDEGTFWSVTKRDHQPIQNAEQRFIRFQLFKD